MFIVQLCEVELPAGDTFEAARVLEEWGQWTALEPDAWVPGNLRLLPKIAPGPNMGAAVSDGSLLALA